MSYRRQRVGHATKRGDHGLRTFARISKSVSPRSLASSAQIVTNGSTVNPHVSALRLKDVHSRLIAGAGRLMKASTAGSAWCGVGWVGGWEGWFQAGACVVA